MSDVDRSALAARLSAARGVDVAVDTVTPLSGGASSATFAVAARLGDRPWPLIFQRSAAAPEPGQLSKATQAALQRIAGGHGLPVAEVIAVTEPGDGLGDGFVMARVDGEALAPRWLKAERFAAARAVLTGQCAAALARLHAVPLSEVAHLPLAAGSPREQGRQMFDLYRSYAVDLPAFDLAFRWADERLHDRSATVLVHGDFRSGNFIIDDTGLAAVLDWELAHLGDPAEDLGWLCVNAWRFGHWRRPVGGFGERDALYDAYAAAGGTAVDRADAQLWEVFGTLRWGMACLQLAHDHLSGRVRSVERAAIGRRVTEVEADLLHLLKYGSV